MFGISAVNVSFKWFRVFIYLMQFVHDISINSEFEFRMNRIVAIQIHTEWMAHCLHVRTAAAAAVR